jgi:hypothetical protein
VRETFRSRIKRLEMEPESFVLYAIGLFSDAARKSVEPTAAMVMWR